MSPSEFSEFSYGYAVTENIVHGAFGQVVGAPIFPTLVQEGAQSGGYDVEIPLHPIPYYFQFKIPQIMVKRSNYCPPGFSCPYYRMHLRTGTGSYQHQSLLDHARAGKRVFYIAPRFHTLDDFNQSYMSNRVVWDSVMIEPTAIGDLDDRHHHVAYLPLGGDWWVYSEPSRREARIDPESFVADVRRSIRTAPRVRSRDAVFAAVVDDILETAEKLSSTREVGRKAVDLSPEVLRIRTSDLRPAQQAAFLASFVLDCQLVIMGLQPDNG
jgi:hypothetical protein